MIGVYDSGYGGLTVLAALREALPAHDLVFLGDNGRAPYGDRDASTILDFSEQCVERLFDEGCRLLVVACHTISCVALRHLQRRYNHEGRRVLGVTIPTAEMAVAHLRTKGGTRVAWVGTTRTVASRTPAEEIAKLAPEVQVHLVAAPLLAPLVEEGLEASPLAELAVAHYLRDLPPQDALVLGCTHYPLLAQAFRKVVPPGLEVLDPSTFIALRLGDWLARHPGFSAPNSSGAGSLRVMGSGDPQRIRQRGERLYGASLPSVEHVAEAGGRLAHRSQPEVVVGQVTR